jgi:hypothetical protein
MDCFGTHLYVPDIDSCLLEKPPATTYQGGACSRFPTRRTRLRSSEPGTYVRTVNYIRLLVAGDNIKPERSKAKGAHGDTIWTIRRTQVDSGRKE